MSAIVWTKLGGQLSISDGSATTPDILHRSAMNRKCKDVGERLSLAKSIHDAPLCVLDVDNPPCIHLSPYIT